MANITQFEHLKIQLEAILLATNNFSNEHFIGQGGFGKVYMGEIVHSKGLQTKVALKRLDRKFGQGDPEFWKEIMMLSFYRHENIVSLLGFCDESGEKILVYEYASKKSLDLHLKNNELNWVQRLKICVGAARGLAYLHTPPADTQLRILHRDIKSSNILLDDNWNAKISDFGLSKFGPANHHFTYLISNVVGTFGYCDPLYVESGLLTKESDVYSFGVVLFEVLCGRLCIGHHNDKQRPLIGLVREYYEENKISEIIYGNIKDEINPDSLKIFTDIAHLCLKRERKERPSMMLVVGALERTLMYQANADGGVKIGGTLNLKDVRITALETSRNLFTDGFNPYLIFDIKNNEINRKKVKTSVKHNELNPEWNEEFTLYVERGGLPDIEIHVINVVSVEKHEYMGTADLSFKNLPPEIILTCDFEIEDVSSKPIGKLLFEMVYKPLADDTCYYYEHVCPVPKAPIGTPNGGGLLVVIIRQAQLYVENGFPNTSVSLVFRGELRNTQIMMNTNFPIWEQEFTFMLEKPPTKEELHLEVINNLPDKRITYRQESLGCVDISLANVVNKKRSQYDITPSSDKFSLNLLHVELQWRTPD